MIEILLGTQDPDAGNVHRPTDLSIGYLPQELEDELKGSVLEVTLQGAAQIVGLQQRLLELQDQLTGLEDPNQDQLLKRIRRNSEPIRTAWRVRDRVGSPTSTGWIGF